MRKITISLSLLFINVASAFAEEAEHGGEHHHAGIESLMWPTINFIIFVGIMYFLLRKAFAQAWDSRRISLEGEINRGANDLRAAEGALEDAKAQLSTFDTESRKLKETIVADGRLESEQILEESKRRAEFVARQAKENVTAEQRSAEVALRREMGKKVLDRAAVMLKQEITPEVDKELRRGVLSGVKQLS